ncbi:hypothetical protein GQ602_003716 [Ophiocordyceps camponoti-floridani]|uniref:Ecp2 effector protein domain-containing protein n=1 Tax=Ophiocordyceps camponoti-floridani TaxID=2030778 RepID=A0A8H4Q8Q6_9HYPO|nr:hypothetical protein GQ602_003716 [Ophiocordyceps camponoti-floridani]
MRPFFVLICSLVLAEGRILRPKSYSRFFPTKQTRANITDTAQMEKRDYNTAHCSGPDPASIKVIREGINYLSSLGGPPFLPQGPGSCSRVSCSWNSAIWLCNDNPSTLLISNWPDVARSAQRIVDACSELKTDGGRVKGYSIEPGGWRVVIGHTVC